MKSYPSQFIKFPYYQDLKIAHLFDTVHIGKNVTETLWRIIDGRRDKEKVIKICSDIQEANHVMQSGIQSNSDGDRNNLPWLLIEQQSNDVKEVIRRIKFEGELLLGKGRMTKVKCNYVYNTSEFSFLCVSYLFNFYAFINY
jgi:hypothetical protein